MSAFLALSLVTSKLVTQAGVSRGERESGQIPIRLLCCLVSSRAPSEVVVSCSARARLPAKNILPKSGKDQ